MKKKPQKNIPCKLQIIRSARFMAISLSNLVDNLIEEIYKIKCKYGHDYKKCETCEIKFKGCEWFFEYTNVKYNLIECKYLCCNNNYNNVWWKLKEEIYQYKQFSNNDINKFILLLQKGDYPYKHMNDWEKFNEKSLPEGFYSHLNMEGIPDKDYTHKKRFCKDFKIKNSSEYNGLYV